MELGNSTDHRRTDLVALDLATGALLLAPWTAADGWDFDSARWSPDGEALLLGRRRDDAGPLILDWSEQWLDPARPARPIRFDAERVFDVAASLPEGAWFSGTAHDENGPRYTVFRHADGSGSDARGPTGQLVWSPAAREAVILTMDDRLIKVEPQSMTSVTLAESVRHLSESVNEAQVLWSPDGADVLYRADACGLCIQNLASGAVDSLDTSAAGGVFEAHAWTPLGVVATLDTGEVVLLSRDGGAIGRTLGTIIDPAVSPSLDRLIGLVLEPGASRLAIVTVDLETGMEERHLAPTNVLLEHLQWQPALVDVPWPTWTPPGPDPTPGITPGSIELEVSGAFEGVVSLPSDCEVREEGIGITGSAGSVGVQVGVAADGTVTFLSLNGKNFAAFAGKGFEVVPPFVVTNPGSTTSAGSMSFRDVPNIDDVGTVSGSLRWRCPTT